MLSLCICLTSQTSTCLSVLVFTRRFIADDAALRCRDVSVESNDGKVAKQEVHSSVAASSANKDDMKTPVPTTRANTSGSKKKCEVKDVFTAVQSKGRRSQETESFERLLSANNDVTGNCDKLTRRNSNTPAASKPKKRRISSDRHSGNCKNNRLIDAEDIINKHKTVSKDNDLTQNESSVSVECHKTGSNDLTQDASSLSAPLVDQCSEFVMEVRTVLGLKWKMYPWKT